MRRALGKGLTQFLESSDEPEVEPSTLAEAPVSQIVPNPRQPRREFDPDALQELATSIREHGIVQPLVVRPIGPNKFELIAGERRFRAAKLAGLKSVPIVQRAASAQTSLELALIENVQREDISAIECARAYRSLADEFGLTQDQIANKIGKTRGAVANVLRLLKLPQDIQDAIERGLLDEGHGRALLMVDSPGRQRALFERIVAEGLSVREVERLARGTAPSPAPAADRPSVPSDPNVDRLQRRLSEHFGARVELRAKGSGGRISIDFFSEDELDGILSKMGIRAES